MKVSSHYAQTYQVSPQKSLQEPLQAWLFGPQAGYVSAVLGLPFIIILEIILASIFGWIPWFWDLMSSSFLICSLVLVEHNLP